jgi:outer membrane murein-binding lipoprotein Lpp
MLDGDGNEIVEDNDIDTSTETPVMADTGIPQDVADVIRGINKELRDDDVVDDNTDNNTSDDTAGDTDSVATEGEEVTDLDDFNNNVLGYDAETIEKLREINPEILNDIKGLISASDIGEETSEEVVEEEVSVTPTEKVTASGLTEEQIDAITKENPQMAAVIKTLNAQVGQLSVSLNSVAEQEETRNQEAKQKQHVANFRSANKKLDEISEDFPILGEYSKLPHRDNKPDMRNPAVKQRAGIWDYATKLFDGGVVDSFDEAMDESIARYKTKNADNLAMRKVSSELRGRAKKITNRPTSKKTKKKQHAPGSEAEKISIVREAYKAAGVEIRE